MLYDVYYIISQDALQQPVKAGKNTLIVLETEVGDGEKIKRLYQLAGKYLTGNPFCLFLNLQTTLTAEQSSDLTAFLFFSNYHKAGGSPQVVVGGENIALVNAGIEQLQQSAKAQGFATLQITLASALPAIYPAKDQPAIRQAYRGFLQSTVITKEHLYIKANQLADMTELNDALQAEEVQFSQQSPELYALKKQNRELNEQVRQLEQLFQSAQQEISNQVSHNQILRSSSQATALQNYYNNEYEVLPLWFKRLGHVVKAFMGKRSFKSLYSDKVKKYRD